MSFQSFFLISFVRECQSDQQVICVFRKGRKSDPKNQNNHIHYVIHIPCGLQIDL